MAFSFIPTGNFAVDTVIQYILDDTNRPDKLEEIKRRIQRAVIKHHFKDFYKRDLIEDTYNFTNKQALQFIDTTKLIRFRSFSYIKKFRAIDTQGNPIINQSGAVGTLQGGDLTETAPEIAFDSYGFDKTDVMYKAGSLVKINASAPIDEVFIGYFTFPQIEPITALQSWIVNEYPSLIAAVVKQRIFKNAGKDDEERSAKVEEAEELLVLQTNNIRLTVM